MDAKSLVIVRGKACGRLSPHKYVLISADHVDKNKMAPPSSYSYEVINEGKNPVIGAALSHMTRYRISADAVVAYLRASDAPERVFITSGAYEYLKAIFEAPSVPHHLAKMVITEPEPVAMAS